MIWGGNLLRWKLPLRSVTYFYCCSESLKEAEDIWHNSLTWRRYETDSEEK